MTVKVFISWSGSKSNTYAEILRTWIPSVIQAAKPFYSTDDTTKGSRWSAEIARQLDESQIGIICVTRDNLQEPWIMFEAGALSKNLGVSRVCPVLFGIEPTDLQGPLTQFQAARFNKSEIKRLVATINGELNDSALPSDVLNPVFDKWWGELEQKVQNVLAETEEQGAKSMRSDTDLLEEILELSRAIAVRTQRSARIPSAGLAEVVEHYTEAVRAAMAFGPLDPFAEPYIKSLNGMQVALESLVRSSAFPNSLQARLASQMDRTANLLNDYARQREENKFQATDNVDLRPDDFDDVPF